MRKNEIIAEINIKFNDSKERIINYLENTERERLQLNFFDVKENEDEIKDCEIYINDKKLILLIIINLIIKENILLNINLKNC